MSRHSCVSLDYVFSGIIFRFFRKWYLCCLIVQGKPEKAIYFMTQSFEQKVDWVNRLDEVIKSAASNLAPVEESHQECLSVVAVTAASVEVLSACVLDEVVVMGTTQGLSTRELGQEAGPVKQLVGLDSPVHQMVHLPSLQVRYSISSLIGREKYVGQ